MLCGIAISGYSTDDDLERSRSAGFIKHITVRASLHRSCAFADVCQETHWTRRSAQRSRRGDLRTAQPVARVSGCARFAPSSEAASIDVDQSLATPHETIVLKCAELSTQ